MSIGFQFTAPIKQQSAALEALGRLSKQFGYQFFSGEDWARVAFCRMGELQFSFSKTKLSGDACTSTAGAGFHAAAIDFVDALAASEHLKIEMADETEYYDHRDFERMRREHFYVWLEMLVEHCARSEGEQSNSCLCWSLEQYLPEDIAGSVITPFGRFEIRAIVERVRREGVEALAQDFFLWNERERDARFYRNCANSVLWEDCFFQPGSRSEADSAVNQAAIDLLEKAVGLDVSLPIPKAEYALLCTLQGHTPMEASASPDQKSPYVIGYRRGLVSYRIGNTSVTMPGSFLVESEDNTTLWFDPQAEQWRNLRVSAFTMGEGSASLIPQLFANTVEPMESFDAGSGKGYAAFAGEQRDADGECYYQTVALIVCEKQATLITACYVRLEEKAWAMALFRQIRAHITKE